MFLDWFRSKKPAVKLKPKQEVEIEFFADDMFKTYFTSILDVRAKDVVLKLPGTERRPVKVEVGSDLTVTTLDDGKLSYFTTSVKYAGDREFDIVPPAKIESEDAPDFNTGSIEAPVNIEYRAMKLPYNQSAQTHSLSLNGLILGCNIEIPKGTELHIEIQIPGTPIYSFNGLAINSRQNPDAKGKRFLCEVEYAPDAPQADRLAVMRYALYMKRREFRRRQREEAGGKK